MNKPNKQLPKVKKSESSFDDLIRIISDSSTSVIETPLEGFFTVEQISERIKTSPRVVSRLIARGLTAGTIERRAFRIVCTSGRTYPVPHYKAKEPGS
jgi:predicted transcriptional regulator